MNIKIIQKFDNFTATPHQKVVAVKTQEEAEDKIILTAEEDPNRRQSVGDEFRFLFCQQIVSVHTVR